MPEKPTIEWRMVKRRHHEGFVDGNLYARIEPHRVVSSVLELYVKGAYIDEVDDTAKGKRLAQLLLNKETAKAAERLLPVNVQRKIASAMADAVHRAVLDVQEAVSKGTWPISEEVEDLIVHNAAYAGLKQLIHAGLLSADGIKV